VPGARRGPVGAIAGLLLAGLAVYAGHARATDPLAAVLAGAEEPAGVLFEVVESRRSDLRTVMPRIEGYVQRLRARFPGISIAVVSHGAEQFGLMREREQALPQVHSIARRLVTEQDVPVHVCEVNAAWNNVDAADFPDYVDVAAYGPAQVQDYEALGYVTIRVGAE